MTANSPRSTHHRVVVGIDGSRAAQTALAWAADAAARRGAPLHVVHAYHWPI
jgi:nucleotide-binding universal stress UspA family protein